MRVRRLREIGSAAVAPSHTRSRLSQEPVSLNPLYLQGALGYAISELSYTYLTNYDSNGKLVPDVAVTVPSPANGGISSDGKLIVY
ncbi:MAG: hypothetical protein WBE15_16595, partial [Candidatus Cybelea sp.]